MLTTKKLEGSKVEIDAEIGAEDFNLFFQQAVIEAKKDLELPGFRKGMVPEKMVIEKVGQDHLLEEAAELAIRHHWPHVIDEAGVEPIGYPAVQVTKVALGNPLGFKIVISVLESITLPDYKAIAKKIFSKKDEIVVSDEETEKALATLKEQYKAQENNPNLKPLPADDELKKIITDNIRQEKEKKAADKKRVEVLQEIGKETTIALPDVLVTSELEKMEQELKASLTDMGLDWEHYLGHIKKTEEDLKKDWKPQAEERARYGLLLREIARSEKLAPSPEMLEKRADEILRSFTEEERKQTSRERLIDYMYGKVQHEMVFDLLEKQ
ncbi:MAG: trigger factor [Patescibacteria group bacterium]|jgi:FKBP-type peptidyl-prolyl cis-trans isomerase (trigger factor)